MRSQLLGRFQGAFATAKVMVRTFKEIDWSILEIVVCSAHSTNLSLLLLRIIRRAYLRRVVLQFYCRHRSQLSREHSQPDNIQAPNGGAWHAPCTATPSTYKKV